ncbi:MAG: hypothetical protein VWZ97_00825 [Flavobacteriaceae bacterium]
MRNKLLISVLSILFTFSIQAQVGIGTETPNASSILDLSSTSKGFLIPRMTEAQRNAISNPPVGLLVYQTNGQAFYYKDHFWWKILASNDNKSFMVGSIKGGIPNFGSQNLLFGFGNFAYATSGDNNTAIGFMAISSSDGSGNTAVGSNAMRQGQAGNVDGSYNTAVGARALTNGDNGGYNTAIGASSIEKVEGDENSGLGYRTLFNTTTGSNNTGIGANAGDTNATGSNNTFIGRGSDANANNLSNATALGYNAIVNASNKIQLGDSNVTLVETSGTVSASAFVGDGSGLTNLPAPTIQAPIEAEFITLNSTYHGRIFYSQHSSRPQFPDPDTLPAGFECTIVNYSGYEGSLTSPTNTFIGVRSPNLFPTRNHEGIGDDKIVSINNNLGVGSKAFPVNKIGFMSGGTIRVIVIPISGSNFYYVSGDYYYPNN